MGAVASYYLLPPGDYEKNDNYYGRVVDGEIRHHDRLRELALAIVGLGHEIGLHNDFLQLGAKTGRRVQDLIAGEVAYFKSIGIDIAGSASHGSKFARRNSFTNYEIFSEVLGPKSIPRSIALADGSAFDLFSISMRSLGLDYEAYSLKREIYVSDVGSRFIVHGTELSNFQPSIVNDLVGAAQKIIVLIHPDWWKIRKTSKPLEPHKMAQTTVTQSNLTNTAAARQTSGAPSSLAPRFVRSDGKPLRVGIRGDCCSRRAIVLNKSMFPNGVDLVINEKSPSVAFAEAIEGTTMARETADQITDVGSMPAVLRHYYEAQFNRSLLDTEDLDLLVIDTYADMNFELWRDRRSRGLLWVHPKYLNDPKNFAARFQSIGKCTLEAAAASVCRLIDHMRNGRKGLPVLILNQPIEYYPKLDSRREFCSLGAMVAERRSGVYAAKPVARDDLEAADVGSCGPGQTLHFSGATYAKMIEDAWLQGLRDHFQSSSDASSLPSATSPDRLPEVKAAPMNGPPSVAISYQQGCSTCSPNCIATVDGAFKSFAQYFSHGDADLVSSPTRYTPMLIATEDFRDFAKWENHIKTFQNGGRMRSKRKAVALGYYVKPFAWPMHIPDIHAVNHSKEIRSGGPMRGGYLRTIEEMGGAPNKVHHLAPPACNQHWSMTFGVFRREAGHVQGTVPVDERLVAYLSLKRMGDIAVYSQILGHGDHLDDGILVLLHHEVVRWISENLGETAIDLRFVMYGGAESGGDGLFQFKRRSGFTAHRVAAIRGITEERTPEADENVRLLQKAYDALKSVSGAWYMRPATAVVRAMRKLRAS